MYACETPSLMNSNSMESGSMMASIILACSNSKSNCVNSPIQTAVALCLIPVSSLQFINERRTLATNSRFFIIQSVIYFYDAENILFHSEWMKNKLRKRHIHRLYILNEHKKASRLII